MMLPASDLLPAELLADVLERCLPYRVPLHRSTDLTDTPWVFATVCTRWKDIVMSTPRLWSSFKITGRKGPDENWTLRTTELWLSRAKGSLLSVELDVPEFKLSHDAAKVIDPKLLEAFFSSSSQWQHIRITKPSSGLFCLLINIKENMQMLETLDIGKSSHIHFLSTHKSWNAFEHTPKLHTLHLTAHLAPSMMLIPWSQLTTCTLACDVDDMHRHIPLILQLERCTLQLLKSKIVMNWLWEPPSPMPPPPPKGPVKLSSLKFFSIAGHNICDLIARLTLPALTEFHLGGFVLNPGLHQEITNLLNRSSCSLKFLDLFNAYISTTDMLNWLERMPSLIRLDVNLGSTTSDSSVEWMGESGLLRIIQESQSLVEVRTNDDRVLWRRQGHDESGWRTELEVPQELTF